MKINWKKKKQLPLKKALQSKVFLTKVEKAAIIIPIGVNEKGEIVTLNLRENPYLLVAGHVLSGKTEFINCLIASLVLMYKPDELQLYLDDATRVELLSFTRVPHLAVPVNTDIKNELGILQSLIHEMEYRYGLFESMQVADIDLYNIKAGEENRLPYIVHIIFEISDIMAMYPSRTESLVSTLTRNTGITGIHIIAATQRPSPDILTAILKSDFPARACFSVVATEDSVTVLGVKGAEKLDDWGAMLYTDDRWNMPRHLRGFSISDDEIERLVRNSKQ